MKRRRYLNVVWMVILMGFMSIGTAWAQNLDLTIWEGNWFKITERYKGLAFEWGGYKADSETEISYTRINEWNSTENILYATLYSYEDNMWMAWDIDFYVIGGTKLDFLIWFEFSDFETGSYLGFTARVTGKQNKEGNISSARLRSLGGYYVEIDDYSEDHRAGGINITGNWIPESKLPPGILR